MDTPQTGWPLSATFAEKCPPYYKTAIHEAGHYAFSRWLGIGRATRVVIFEKDDKWQGFCARGLTLYEELLIAEKNGEPLKKHLRPGWPSDALKRYSRTKQAFAQAAVLEIVGGGAAAYELAGGEKGITTGDIALVGRIAHCLAPESEYKDLLAAAFESARECVRGPLRHSIHAVAAKLCVKHEVLGDELEKIWLETLPKEMPRLDYLIKGLPLN